MLPGASGLRWIPRKIAGIAMMTMEPSIGAIVMLSVVFERAIHLYLSGCPSDVCSSGSGCRLEITPTLVQPTSGRLLDHNYLPPRYAGQHARKPATPARLPPNPLDTRDLNYSAQLASYSSLSILLWHHRGRCPATCPLRQAGGLVLMTIGRRSCSTELTHSTPGPAAPGSRALPA